MRASKVTGLMLLTAGIAFTLIGTHGLSEQSTAVTAYERLACEATVTDGDEAQTGAIDWDALLAVNPDVVAWCHVEGTSISLPVCQASDEDSEFWLSHDLWGNESPAGTLYIDHRANAQSQHILCYGHHLTGTGGMFSELYHCHEQDEFDRVLTGDLLWSTPDGKTARLRPLCSSIVDKDDAGIQHFTFGGMVDFQQWLQSILAQSASFNADTMTLAKGATRAVTLVTCSSNLTSQPDRTIVTFIESQY